jgi:hypothetical protein
MALVSVTWMLFALDLEFDWASYSVFIILLMFSLVGLMVVVPITIYWFLLWWIARRNKQGEIPGPALRLAHWLSLTLGWPVQFFSEHILPTVSVFVVILLAFVLASRGAFEFASGGGFVCSRANSWQHDDTVKLTTNNVCQATTILLKAKDKYRLEEKKQEGMPPQSIGWRKRWVGLPFRRYLTEKWFVVIARIDQYGDEEYALTTNPYEITPKRDGTLYLFVNDAVVGLPGLYNYFYRDAGTEDITVTRVATTAQ